ncbi:MAG: hypothetical protein HY978_03195, partial [Candidatus Liptonbacteria bacterium]|nr:hypothetical protein [Candidatus Liptonbacteria bacterium]
GASKVTNAMLAGSIAASKLATTTAANILVANASEVPTWVASSGDVTVDNAGAFTIGGAKVNLGTMVTSTLPVANGGTGAATLTGLLVGNGTSAVTATTTLAWNYGGTGSAYFKVAGPSAVRTYTFPDADTSILGSPMTTLGDTMYGGASGVTTRLAGNTTAVKQFLSQTGDGGGNSAAPGWATLVAANISDLNSATTGITKVGTITTGAWNGTPIDLSTYATSTLPVANGGTGAATLTGLLVGNGTSAVTATTTLASNYGGTGSGYFAISGPAALRTYTFPDADATILYSGGSATIGSGGTAITKHLSATGSIQFGGGTVATSTCSTGTVTVTGATTNDSVALGPPTDIEAGLVWSGYVSGASTVTVRACAITGTVTSASKTWRADVWQH